LLVRSWAAGPSKPKGEQGMKTYAILGFILIAVGIVAFAYQGVTYTTSEQVVNMRSIHLTAERTGTLPLPPIVGALALAGGILVLVTGSQKKPKKATKRQCRRWLP